MQEPDTATDPDEAITTRSKSFRKRARSKFALRGARLRLRLAGNNRAIKVATQRAEILKIVNLQTFCVRKTI